MPSNTKKINAVFFAIVFAHLLFILFNAKLIEDVTKICLIPCLIFLVYKSVAIKNLDKRLILVALLFSWLGDTFLIFENRNALFFIFGLVCFLTTHILYIVYFLKISSPNISLLKKNPIFVLLVFAYGVGLVYFLYPHLGDLQIPVLIYATIICVMLLCSLHVYFKTKNTATYYFVMGATFFVVSDSLLAINKFNSPFLFAEIAIMLTYCVAQYFIVTGFINQNKND